MVEQLLVVEDQPVTAGEPVAGICVSVITGVLAGLAPAWHAARTEIVSALRQA